MSKPFEVTRTGARVVRVRDTATGHHITVSAQVFKASEPGRYVRLASSALTHDGLPAGPKFRKALGTPRTAGAPAPIATDTPGETR
jgi:hypothetical protein